MSEVTEYTVNRYHLLDYGLFIGTLFLGFSCLYFGCGLYLEVGLKETFYFDFLKFFRERVHPENDYLVKVIALVFSLCYMYGVKGKKELEINKTIAIYIPVIIGFVLYAVAFPLMIKIGGYKFTPAVIYHIMTITGFILLIKGFGNYFKIMKLTSSKIKDKLRGDEDRITHQTRRIETDMSVNIKFANSEFNLVNPITGTGVTGNPGTGKTAVFGHAFIEQLIKKGFTALIHDFKEGRETEFTLKVFRSHAKEILEHNPGIQFLTFNMNDPRHSVRLNPVSPRVLDSVEHCIDAASDFYYNMLTKAAVSKKGEFFTESGRLIICNALTFLRFSTLEHKKSGKDSQGNPVAVQGNCCTIPHLITLLSLMNDDVYDILRNKSETKMLFSAFTDALDSNAGNQLAGQLASGKLPFSFLGTPKIFWALSSDEISLDINNPESPKILSLVSGEATREAYAPILGMIVSRVIKEVNKRDRKPCLLYLDELPTVFVRTIDNLIATARENKIAAVLIFQDISQLVRDYGREAADVVANVIANYITGRVKGENAKKVQEWVGKIPKTKYNFTKRSQGDVDVGISAGLEYAIPESVVSNLHNFEFCGFLADGLTIKEELEQPVFKDRMFDNDEQREDFFNKKFERLFADGNIPEYQDFGDLDMEEIILRNFEQIQKEVEDLISQEKEKLLTD